MSGRELAKGFGLEFRTAAYFQAHGYLVRRGVVLSVAADTAEATDIDVLGVRFSTPLREQRLVAECKDRKRPQPFERILWTRGLAAFAHADHSVVVIPRPPWQAREFGAQADVEIVGTEEIDGYLHSVAPVFQPFGEAEPKLAARWETRKHNVRTQAKELIREDLKVRQMLVIGHPLTGLNRIIRTLSTLGRSEMSPYDEVTWVRRYVCFNAAVVASVLLARFAAESKWTPDKDWADNARKRLTYGDVPPRKARELARLAFDRDVYDDMPMPEYTAEIVEVIKSLVVRPKVAAAVAYAMDMQLFGWRLGSLDKRHVSPVLGELQEDALKLAKKILSALSFAAQLPATFWDALVDTPSIEQRAAREQRQLSILGEQERAEKEQHSSEKAVPATAQVMRPDDSEAAAKEESRDRDKPAAKAEDERT